MPPRITNETREQKFRRIAEIRTNAVIDKLRLLGNLSNKRVYSFTEIEIDTMFNEINKQLRITRLKFKPPKKERFQFRA